MSQCNRCLSNPCRCEGINAWSEIRAEQPRPALKEFRTALNALYLEVEPSIANDIVKLATAAIAEAESEPALPAPRQDGPAFYVASRASIPARSAMWRDLRSRGMNIVSSWIDESGEGETESFEELWQRIYREIQSSTALILYAEQGDFPLKGALIEVGMAIGMGKPVMLSLPGVVLEGRTYKPLGSWIEHPAVTRLSTSLEAFTHWQPLPQPPQAALSEPEK